MICCSKAEGNLFQHLILARNRKQFFSLTHPPHAPFFSLSNQQQQQQKLLQSFLLYLNFSIFILPGVIYIANERGRCSWSSTYAFNSSFSVILCKHHQSFWKNGTLDVVINLSPDGSIQKLPLTVHLHLSLSIPSVITAFLLPCTLICDVWLV